MNDKVKNSGCDLCGNRCILDKKQQRSYHKIPSQISPVWHSSFGDSDAKVKYFGTKTKRIPQATWTLFPDTQDEPAAVKRRVVLSKADEAQLFLQYNYARFRLGRLVEKQHEHPTRARAVAMVAWNDRVQQVRSDLVNANMSLVLAMARRMRIPDVDFPELISEGNMVLLRAIDKFDVSRGFKFSTYACRAILKGFSRMASNSGRYYSRFGASYNPDLEPDDENQREHEKRLSGAIDDMREVLVHNTAELSAVELVVIVERFGLSDGSRGKTLAKVGEILGVSIERVRQIQKVALVKLHDKMSGKYQAA